MGELNNDAFIVYQTVPWFRLFINIFGRQIRYSRQKKDFMYKFSVEPYPRQDYKKQIWNVEPMGFKVGVAGEDIKENRLVYVSDVDGKVYESQKPYLTKEKLDEAVETILNSSPKKGEVIKK